MTALALCAPALAQGIGTSGFPRDPKVPGIIGGKPALVSPTCPSGRTLVFVNGANVARCAASPMPAQQHPSAPTGQVLLFCADGFTLGYTPDGVGLCSNDLRPAQ